MAKEPAIHVRAGDWLGALEVSPDAGELEILERRRDRVVAKKAFLEHVAWLFMLVGEKQVAEDELPWLDVAVRLREASELARQLALTE